MIHHNCISGLIIILVLLVVESHGQESAVNEQQVMQMADDTAKVNRLIAIGRDFCSRNNQKALFYLQESLFLSNKLNYKEGVAWSYLWLGRVYYYKDEYDLAGNNLSKSIKLLSDLNDHYGQAYYYFATGSISNLRGNHVNALKEFQEVVRYSRLAGNELMESAGTYALGTIHLVRHEYSEALEYMKQALAIKFRIDDFKGIANIYTSIGKSHEMQKDYDSALFYYNKGFEIRKERGDNRAIANSLVVTGKLRILMKDYEPAMDKLARALEIYTLLDERTGQCIVNTSLALAGNYRGLRREADRYMAYALEDARSFNNPSLVLECYKTMAEMRAFDGDFHEAYRLSGMVSDLQDSLNSANREEIIQELEARYNVEQKNNEIENLSNRNSIQQKNIIILSISIGALMLILLLLIILFRLKAKNHRRQKQLFQQEKTIRKQQENIKQKEMQLLHESVESKNRELAAKAIEMLRINETIGEVINKLESMNRVHANDPGISAHIREIARELENQTNTNTWREFDKIFKNIYNEFYDNLLRECPSLTASEIKIAALLKLNLSTKEIAAITYKTEEGIKSTRYRLRKKLNLTGDDKLVPYLMKL